MLSLPPKFLWNKCFVFLDPVCPRLVNFHCQSLTMTTLLRNAMKSRLLSNFNWKKFCVLELPRVMSIWRRMNCWPTPCCPSIFWSPFWKRIGKMSRVFTSSPPWESLFVSTKRKLVLKIKPRDLTNVFKFLKFLFWLHGFECALGAWICYSLKKNKPWGW